ncbi:unnamed protein product, partial [Porites lobata]
NQELKESGSEEFRDSWNHGIKDQGPGIKGFKECQRRISSIHSIGPKFNYYCKGVCFIDTTDGIRVQSPTKTVRQNHATYKRLTGVHCIAGISHITRKTTSTTNCTKSIEKLEWFQPIIISKHTKNTEEEEEKDSISNSFETAIRIY